MQMNFELLTGERKITLLSFLKVFYYLCSSSTELIPSVTFFLLKSTHFVLFSCFFSPSPSSAHNRALRAAAGGTNKEKISPESLCLSSKRPIPSSSSSSFLLFLLSQPSPPYPPPLRSSPLDLHFINLCTTGSEEVD